MPPIVLLDDTDVPDDLLNLSQSRDGFTEEFPFTSRWIRIGASIQHFVDEGSGPVLLMVHGNPTWSFAWRHLIRNLSVDYRVIAIDHLGCGFSEKPQTDVYTLEQHIKRLEQLILALDLRNVTLFAHDWGGAIGMGCAGRQPDLFSRFVLLNTAAFRSRRIPLRISACRIPLLGPFGVQRMNLFSLAAVQMAVTRPLTSSAKAGLLAPYDSVENRIAVREFVLDIPMKPTHRSYQTLVRVEESLSKLANRPMQLIWGMRDWCFTPEFLYEFERRFPNAAVHRISSAGHYVFEDAADDVLETSQRFLKLTADYS
ncbi:MAG: alpha/beta fold hydrolase [Fuerstiella sp.]|nr:alpha/beta fold hydrolase [Fuerstiella sp.]